MSLAFDGSAGNHHSGYYHISTSPDCRYVAFPSSASNFVLGDTNGVADIFVRDRQTGATLRASIDSVGTQGNGECLWPAISADGRYVAFHSQASNLVAGDNNQTWDVFVHDFQSGTTERVSINTLGVPGSDNSSYPSISTDGRFVAFSSMATLVNGDTNGSSDIYVRDRLAGTTERVSVASGGTEANDHSWIPSISGDGRYIAFHSEASNLVAGDTNFYEDAFVHDRHNGITERVSVSSTSAQANHRSTYASITPDGRFVVFECFASDLVPGDTNFLNDIFLRDRQSGTTERISVSSNGAEGNGTSGYYSPASVSPDGRYVTFQSSAWNLVGGDTTQYEDIFVRDRQAGTTELVSVNGAWEQANQNSYDPVISADGRYATFRTRATNLVPGGTIGAYDVYVRDRLGGSAFTSVCDPGVGGVIACPCSNPPSGGGRGCDNSASTGGAILSASGGTYLSSDSLVFTTSGERSTALSIVAQWIGSNPTGVVFGQGVRCTSGTLKRLFNKNAVGGSIAIPDFGAGDPTISARSAAKGDSILAGQSRWYVVYYRDGVVLGGCPASSTFNATQTGQVTWSP